MKLPTFIIIGAAKAGTTSLWEYVRQHPQVYMSWIKEPAYFAYPGGRPAFAGPGDLDFKVVTSWQEYEQLFADADAFAAVGEASTQYIYSAQAAARIHEKLPRVKIIAMLRHPAERAYANYNHWVRRGVESELDFAAALAREPDRMRENYVHWWYYKDQGYYFRQLQPYLELFGRENVRVLLHDDMRNDSERLFRELFDFIGVDPSFKPDMSTKHNQGSIPRSPWLNRVLSRPNAIKSLAKRLLPAAVRTRVTPLLMQRNKRRPEKLDPALRAALLRDYREDVLKLQDLIGRDLSRWLT